MSAVAVTAGDGYFMVGPVGAAYLARAMSVVEREHRLAGVSPPADWVHLREVIDRAAAFAYETAKARTRPAVSRSAGVAPSGLVGTEQVADLAGCSQQWARALLRRGEFATARCHGSVWTVEADEVAAWAVARASRGQAAA